jgi:hypothetical protein
MATERLSPHFTAAWEFFKDRSAVYCPDNTIAFERDRILICISVPAGSAAELQVTPYKRRREVLCVTISYTHNTGPSGVATAQHCLD